MRFVGAQIQKPDFWTIHGHSYTAGAVGTIDQTGRFDALFRASMDAEYNNARNHSVSGSLLVMENRKPGGWCRVFYENNPKRGGPPFAADGGAKLFCYGINDLGTLGTADMAQMTAAYVHASRSCISRARASAVYGSTSTTWTAYGAGFTSAAASEFTDGFVRNATTTVNATITITIPTGYRGEPISICFLGQQGTTQGGIITFSGTAGVTGTMNTSNIMPAVTGSRTPMVKRITNLTSANAGQTIICTNTTANNSTWFDSWWVEASDPPVVLFCNINRLTASGYGAFPNWTGTEAQKDADVLAANQAINVMLQEFDDMVQEVPLDETVRKDPDLTFDGIHLNERGASLAVNVMWEAYSRCAPPKSKGDSIASINGPALRMGSVIRPRVSTHWYTADCRGVNNTTHTLVSGTLIAMPFQITEARNRFTQFSVDNVGSVGTTTIRWGIYNDTNFRGYPQFLEFEHSAGVFTIPTGAGAKTSTTFTWVPDPGLYWLTIKGVTIGATPTVRAITGPSMVMPTLATTGAALSATTNPCAWSITGQGIGALSEVFPSGAALIDSAPLMGIKLQ